MRKASAANYSALGTGYIKLVLMVGAWGKSHGSRPLTDAEREALAAEYRRKMLIEAEGWLAKAKAADDPEWIAAVERTIHQLRAAQARAVFGRRRPPLG